jgi:hypothetical protein
MYKKLCITLLCSLFIIPCHGMKHPHSKDESKRSVTSKLPNPPYQGRCTIIIPAPRRPNGSTMDIWLPKPDDKYSSTEAIAAGTIHRGPDTGPPIEIAIPIARRPSIQRATGSKSTLAVAKHDWHLQYIRDCDYFDNAVRRFHNFGVSNQKHEADEYKKLRDRALS